MRNRMVKGKGLTVVGVVLTALLLVTACAAPTALPPGQKVVEFGNLASLTGGAVGLLALYGELDYVRYFNEQGGIPGVTIRVAWRDYGTTIPAFLSGYHAFADRGLPLIDTTAGAGLVGFDRTLEKDQIVILNSSGAEAAIYPVCPWIFSIYSTPGEEAAVLLNYFRENWKEQRPPRLQFIAIDYAFGREPAKEIETYAPSIGFEVLPLEVVPIVIIDATVQLLRIRERQPDLVYIQHILTGAGPIMRDVERLGLQGQMQFAGNENIVEPELIAMAPVSTEGLLTPKAYPWIDETEIPGVKTMTDMELKYRGEIYETGLYMRGWCHGALACEAVKRAGEELGYDNIDGAAVKRALENMKDADAAGIVKFTYVPEDRRGVQSYAVYQVQGGKIVRVSDWRDVPILVP